MEVKRTTSRKLFRHLPGLQDVKNGPKTLKNIRNLCCLVFAVFPLKGVGGMGASLLNAPRQGLALPSTACQIITNAMLRVMQDAMHD